METALRASVVVCTHNRGPLIEETLDSLVEQEFPEGAFEVVVVDNASRDMTPEIVRTVAARHPGHIRLVREPVLGLSNARNRGIRESRGDIIAFTDDDARVTPRWLRALVEACERPGVACAGGPVRAILDGPLPTWLTAPFLPYLSIFDKGPREVELCFNEYPRGVNIAFPRRAFREVGLFSTVFGRKGRVLLSNEEIEICYRLERLGQRILYIPEAAVHHAVHADRLTLPWFQRRFYWQGRSEAYFDLVHRGRGFVGGRMMELARLAVRHRVGGRPAEHPAPLHRHFLTWTSVGYGVGALHGWITRLPKRGRPAAYDGGTGRVS